MAVCYRHPSRETGVSCSSCGRPICPDCMTPTPVGMRCPECSRERTKVRRMPSVQSTPVVTQALIAINVLAFLIETAAGAPLGGGGGGSVWFHGSLFGPAITAHNPFPGFTGTHEYWRLVTSGFLHDGLLHIFINMISLWFVGSALEPAIGRVNFLAVYFVSLLAGSFGALWFQPMIPDCRRVRGDLRDLRRVDRGGPGPGHPALAERTRVRADLQPAVLAQRSRHLDRGPSRRAVGGLITGLLDRRGGGASAAGVGGARGLCGCRRGERDRCAGRGRRPRPHAQWDRLHALSRPLRALR